MSLKKKQIDLLYVPPFNKKNHNKKKKEVIRFMNLVDKNGYIKVNTPILDIGPENYFDSSLTEFTKVRSFNTVGNLDRNWYVSGCTKEVFKTVCMFDIIEHLKNPDTFLCNLKSYIDKETDIYITFPFRWNSKYWSHNHWHEMEPKRFKILIEDAGYHIVDSKTIVWWYALLGIRPFLKYFYARHHYCLYHIRLK